MDEPKAPTNQTPPAPAQPTAVASPIRSGRTTQPDTPAAAATASAASSTAPVAQQEPAKGVADIHITHLTKRFGRKTVLDDITLTMAGGELIALMGGSGCGKSTLANIIIGELEPTKGSVEFSGTCGFVPQKNLVHENLRVKQQLSFYASAVKRLPLRQRRKRVKAVLEELGLDKVKRTVIARCSGGETRRVSVGCELLANPDVLFLDEPTSGLDPGDSGDVIELLRSLVRDNNMTVVVISHDFENLEMFDKVAFLAAGKICYYGTPARLHQYFGTTTSRRIYNLLRDDPQTYIRNFENWVAANPGVRGGLK